jgi:heme/copper-type cytochrome/quinol oxidase subunit 3
MGAKERAPLAESRAAVAHHFDDLTPQHEAVNLGMWTLLLTEIMFFGGLFLGIVNLMRISAEWGCRVAR